MSRTYKQKLYYLPASVDSLVLPSTQRKNYQNSASVEGRWGGVVWREGQLWCACYLRAVYAP